MDNSPTRWAASPAIVAVGWGVTAILVASTAWIALSGDGPGAVLFGLASVAVGAFSLYGTLVRPRLSADLHGIRARTFGGTTELSWPEVTRVRLRTTRRLGRDSVTLEIEAGELFLVFGRIDLGEDPRDVLDVLTALRAA